MDIAPVPLPLPITIDPSVMSGVPVFRGTRVPVQTLLDDVADGSTFNEFLENFPSVQRSDALQLLASIGELMAARTTGKNPH